MSVSTIPAVERALVLKDKLVALQGHASLDPRPHPLTRERVSLGAADLSHFAQIKCLNKFGTFSHYNIHSNGSGLVPLIHTHKRIVIAADDFFIFHIIGAFVRFVTIP